MDPKVTLTRLRFPSAVLVLTSIAVLCAHKSSPCDSLAELEQLPIQYDGLELRVEAVKDTFIIGEPITVEILLINASNHEVFDPCILSAAVGGLALYAYNSDTSVVRMENSFSGSLAPVPDSRLLPGCCIGTVVIIGGCDMLAVWGLRGPSEIPIQYFDRTGLHRLLATFYHVAERDSARRPVRAGRVRAAVDSFFVREPAGWNAAVYRMMGDDLLCRLPLDQDHMAYDEEAKVQQDGTIQGLYHLDSASVYAPYIWARYAHNLVRLHRGQEVGFDKAMQVLKRLVRNFPGHRLSQEAEFEIAEYTCKSGRNAAAREIFDMLLEKYPTNGRANQTCALERPHVRLREDLTIRTVCRTTP